MPVYIDQIGKEVLLDRPPRRIISLVPSQTELLSDLGLDNEVAGITRFCVHPKEWFRSKTRIGGTKQVHIDKVRGLMPDLIIANKEENLREQVLELEQIAPVWTSDIRTTNDALAMISAIGSITGTDEKAFALIQKIAADLASIESLLPTPIPVAYLIWKDPYMTVGGDSFISEMLGKAGLSNVFANLNRYPEISINELAASGAKLLLLSSEPYPFAEKHITELRYLLPGKACLLIDGEMFSWYGSRMQYFLPYLKELLPKIAAICAV
jgi:ABC-type Fe3+-hydroxamate transport system substrate-binding protein